MQNLFTTLLFAASAMALPTLSSIPRDDEPESCMTKGTHVSEWTVSDFDFHASYIFTTPSHQNSWGYVNFTLENPALDYKPVCSASSSQLDIFFYGTQIFTCETPNEHDEATFTFNRASGDLRLNQTWSCLEEGGRVMAKGGVVFDLDCKETKYQNDDWKQGQIYSTRDITCEKVTKEAPIEELSAVL